MLAQNVVPSVVQFDLGSECGQVFTWKRNDGMNMGNVAMDPEKSVWNNTIFRKTCKQIENKLTNYDMLRQQQWKEKCNP